MRDYQPILAVDFDGTIVEHRFPDIGPELPHATDTLKDLQASGWLLILWTCREGRKLQEAVEWCADLGLDFDAVNENAFDADGFGHPKVVATVYVDDRNYGCEGIDWPRIADALEKKEEKANESE